MFLTPLCLPASGETGTIENLKGAKVTDPSAPLDIIWLQKNQRDRGVLSIEKSRSVPLIA